MQWKNISMKKVEKEINKITSMFSSYLKMHLLQRSSEYERQLFIFLQANNIII